ncbi:Serine/threonine-protein kinase CTR1 [Tetrabaena socialis]|uniref:Serine/threonine-protein kinase CTR1 n=1 Tax=Tetrabaena socialis TaxID=47790 RepID=A0A2J8A3W8_9CHLO|nr:Serine/threonine-protein kinase CTR1 [Tetrabaena socialis]|eukprot:PNH07216.1 Serine/threonine-protein kinase CTR1 [Tetrabaena socialis]
MDDQAPQQQQPQPGAGAASKCGAQSSRALAAALGPQQGLRSCPLVVGYTLQGVRQQGQPPKGKKAAADGAPLCSSAVVMNNGRDALYGWQLVWRFTNRSAYSAADVDGAVLVTSDLKPQNVLLDERGRAKVCDFGIAKIKDRTLLSTRNAHAGTPAYMAPEQFEGRPVSEKVDVYAFGMTLYECLSGEQPWKELQNPMQVIFVVGVQCQRPPLPPDCPEPLAELIGRCWADDPVDRPAFSEVVPLLQAELVALGEDASLLA